MIPLAATAVQPVTAPPATPPLLDNPGNLPVVIADSDPSMSPSASWCGWRWRASIACASGNEGGSDALALGAVHFVGRRRSDGSALPGSDHIVTFDGPMAARPSRQRGRCCAIRWT